MCALAVLNDYRILADHFCIFPEFSLEVDLTYEEVVVSEQVERTTIAFSYIHYPFFRAEHGDLPVADIYPWHCIIN